MSTLLRPAKHLRTALSPLPLAIHLALASALGSLPLLAQAADSQASQQRYQIPAGPLGEALNQFAQQSGVAIIFDASQVETLHSPGLSGDYSVAQGFAQLLQGSGYSAEKGESGYRLVTRSPDTGHLELEATSVTSNTFGTITEESKSYTPGTLATATRLVLTPRETPQSISVVTRQHIDDFGLNSVDDIANHTPGVSIVTYDSDRTAFMVRGFGVDNFQYDGIPSALSAGGESLSDMAIYDRVEILKGSTGLLNGVGSPGASFNLIRKKPTHEFKGHISASAGSWDNYRSELDLSGPLSDTGNIRGRTVLAYQDNKSYRDRYDTEVPVFYGILEFDVDPDTLLTIGADYQENNSNNSTWGGVPIYDSNGNFNKMSRSFSNAVDWSYYDQYTRTVFATVEHNFANGWIGKIHLNHQIRGYDSTLGSVAGGNPDPATGAGTYLWTGIYNYETTTDSANFHVTGPWEIFGREHELVVGGNVSKKHRIGETFRQPDHYNDSVDDYYSWTGNVAEPEWQLNQKYDETTREKSAYTTGRFFITDNLKVILGGRVSDHRAETVTKNGVFTPYAGITYDLNENFTAYGSYTSIFTPQTVRNEQGSVLAPLEGNSYEAGIKGEFFGGRLNSNIAYFEIEQDNYAVRSGNLAPDGTNAYKAEQGVISKGYELELSGELAAGWNVQGGFTHTKAERDGESVSTIAPENQFTLFTSYTIPNTNDKLTLGGGGRWQSKTWAAVSNPLGGTKDFTEGSFWLFDLMARYKISDDLTATINVKNALDKKYVTIMDIYGVYSWGDPRSITTSVRWDF